MRVSPKGKGVDYGALYRACGVVEIEEGWLGSRGAKRSRHLPRVVEFL